MVFRTLLALFALAVGVAGPATAQVSQTGTIVVVVQDQDGGRLPGVVVTARAADTVTTRSAVTNEEGVATLEALAPSALYEISAQLSGFQDLIRPNILVRSGQTVSVPLTLTIGSVTEAITVTAASPVVDTRSATTGQDITLQLTESLPTGRSYQSYLQIVPGVMPDDPTTSGNPAARGGINYSDIAGNMGVSSDNAYYFDGINVTDPVTGTFGANLNTEIIQEQKVITGGIPAEFVGTPGLISNVITKSGSNRFSGSVNYFFQNTNLAAENQNGPSDEFGTRDNGYTFGGPIVRDKAWFFGSYRYNSRADDVSTLDTQQFLRSVDNTQHQGFAKGTYSPTMNDLISFTYLSDPTEITGRRERDITNARDRGVEQGGHRYGGLYTRVAGNVLLEIGANKHNGELSQISAIRQARNEILFQGDDIRTLTDEQLGGFGQDLVNERDTMGVRGSMSYTTGRHTFKGGVDWSKNVNFRDTLYLDSAIYESIAAKYAGAGVTAANIVAGSWNRLAFDHSNPSDYGGFLRTIDARSDRARFYTLYDLDRDGTITQTELGQSLMFASIAGNPNNAVNYDRTFQSATGPQETSSRGLSFFVQDSMTFDRFTFNIGVRAERWEHFATTGENIYTFPWEFAPRLSAVYDLLGDGRHKVSGYFGRYYDPIRNNMTNFAGTLTGSILEEQVYAGDEWITYRTRGGPAVQDAFFAPTTQTPYTDDLQFGYAVDLGNNMSFEALYINRRTRDILEDYDLELYATAQDGEIHYPGPTDDPNTLFLGLDYFGYTENPGSNFVIATLEGGERNYQGLEFVFRKRFADRWQLLTSYNWNDADGNTNSDSNADFQGDVIWLDPRAPNQLSRQPGNITHLLKGGGSYTFDMGLQLGAFLNWNSGTFASRTFLASGRNLPVRVSPDAAYAFAGVTERWLAENAVGSIENPAWGTVDVRMQYNRNILGDIGAEAFVDVFNIANNQDSIRDQDLVAGSGSTAFGEPIRWVTGRRAFLGVRLKF